MLVRRILLLKNNEEKNMSKNTLEICDLYLAVFLKAKYGFKIIDIDKQEGRLTFVFDIGNHDSQELIGSFYNGNDKVSANAFVRELKDLKALIHNF
jgi:hypothetical protein